MKLSKGFIVPNNSSFGADYLIKLNKFIYELKQSRGMWYNRLSEYLLKEGYKNDIICPYIFMKGLEMKLSKVINCLKKEFEMKDL
ncbi:hypothetical protein CR513_58592, partial [Mucuna pruriens]